MKNLILILSIVCLFACKKEEEAPDRKISYRFISDTDTAYAIKINEWNLQAKSNKYSWVWLYHKGEPIQASIISGNTSSKKTIIMVLDKDTILNQSSYSDPFTVSIITP